MSFAANLQNLKQRLKTKALSCGRAPEHIRIIAVSKLKPAQAIVAALETGQCDFGENYAQELVQKAQQLQSHPQIRWHMLGHLQKNKIKSLLPHLHMLHTLDSLPLAEALEKNLSLLQKRLAVLVQVKIATDQTKSGCAPKELFSFLQKLAVLPHLQVQGLMTIGTQAATPENTRAEMRQLKNLLDEANAARMYPTPLTELSMGMSGDFEIAIEEGATLLRIGTALFGER